MLTFNKETHEYLDGDKKLISVTQLMRKHGLSPDYGNVPEAVLKAKAERGSLIHKEIEEYIKNDEIGFTGELKAFVDQIKENSVEVLASETMVNNDIVAGTADLILYKDGYIIADIKTTANLHKDALSWQLSIYAYLLNNGGKGIEIKKGQAYHFNNDGELNVVDIPLQSFEEVERLIECERQGVEFKQELIVPNYSMQQIADAEKLIRFYETKKKEAEKEAEAMRAAVIQAMKDNNKTTFENDTMRITLKEAYSRETIDTAKFKKEKPELAEKYIKKSITKESLVITFKEDK